MTITTPALLFPAISLLMLAYTNKFLTLAQLVRQLTANLERNKNREAQMNNLNLRLTLIKYMQGFGAVSFLFCTFSMFALFLEKRLFGEVLFGVGLILLAVSLFLLFYEVTISTKALKLEISGLKRS